MISAKYQQVHQSPGKVFSSCRWVVLDFADSGGHGGCWRRQATMVGLLQRQRWQFAQASTDPGLPLRHFVCRRLATLGVMQIGQRYCVHHLSTLSIGA